MLYEFDPQFDLADFAAEHAAHVEADAELRELIDAAERRMASPAYRDAAEAMAKACVTVEQCKRAIERSGALDEATERGMVRAFDAYDRAESVMSPAQMSVKARAAHLVSEAGRAAWIAEHPEAYAREQEALDHAKAEHIAAICQGRTE